METLSFICMCTGEEEQGGLSDKQCEEGSLSLRTQQSTSPQIGHPASGTQVQNNQVNISCILLHVTAIIMQYHVFVHVCSSETSTIL